MSFRFHTFMERARPARGARPLIAAAGISPAGAPVCFMEDDRLPIPPEADSGPSETADAGDAPLPEAQKPQSRSSCSCCLLTFILLIAVAVMFFLSIIKIAAFVCVIILFAWVFSSVLF